MRADETDTQVTQAELDQSKFDKPDASDSDYEIDESDSEEDNEPTESD